MIIESIRVKNFRQIKDKEYRFRKGVNIIKGFNEEGKSTLFESILTSLFEDPKKISKNTLENIKSWDSDKYPILEYTVLVNNQKFTILKDFDKKESFLNGDKKSDVSSFIKNALYLDKDIFLRLSSVKQNQISVIQGNVSSFQKSLFSILSTSSGSNVNIMDLISSLDKKIREMRLGIDRKVANEGILKQLDLEVMEKEKEIKILNEDYIKNKDEWQKILDKKEELSNLEKDISELRENIESVEKARALSDQIKVIENNITEIENKINRVTSSMERLKNIKDKDNINMLDPIESFYSEVLNIRERIKLREKDLEKLEKEKESIDNLKLKPIRKNSPLVIITSAILFLMTAVSALFGFYIFIALFIDIIFIGIYLRFIDFNKLKGFKNPTITHIDSIKEEINVTKKRLDSILKESKVSSVDEFFKIRTKLLSSKEEILKLQSTINGILSGDKLEDLETQETNLIIQKKELEIDFNKVKDFLSVDPLKIRKDKILLDDKEFEKFSLEDEIIALEARISNISVLEEKLEEEEIRLNNLQDKRNYYFHKIDIYKIILDNFLKAKDEVFDNISKDLNTLGSLWIEKITEGKYSKIDISSNDTFSIFDNKQKRFITTKDNLSTGLLDQIYILARLSILNVILKDKETMIFFDDPFVTFDGKRLSVMKELLREFGVKHQMFIFTCHDSFDDMI